MTRHPLAFLFAAGSHLFSAGVSMAAPSVPSPFVVETIGSGFTSPTAIAVLPGGRMLVAEKSGKVYTLLNGVKSASPLWSRENEVLNHHDRGLLGLAVDPNYATNRYIYLMYTVDPDSNGTDTNNDAFGRIVRYQVSATDSNVVNYASRAVLMGVSWRYGPVSCSPSHTIGTLRFGSDGSLLASMGDGASYTIIDAGGNDAGVFGSGANKSDPYEDIGAFRSQSLTSLAGKILRINPANGHGYPSNPYWDGNPTSIRSRVWAYGVRNPFRFGVRPGGSTDPAAGMPGTVYIGDVGMGTWEDMDIVRTPGMNFGWPCYEGMNTQGNGYYTATPAHNGCNSMGTSDNPASQTAPVATWHHSNTSLSIPPGVKGNAAVGGVFYTGTRYPSSYQGRYFFADYGQNWLRVATVNASDQLVSVQSFGTAMDGPVDLITDPANGDVLYVSISTGEVRRIRYPVPNVPPLANGSGSSGLGVAPFTLTFNSAGSADADGDPLSYAWNFGDGNSAAGPAPTHTYTTAGSYAAVLTVQDGRGGTSRDTVRVVVLASEAFPTTTVLDGFNRADGPLGGSWTGDDLSIFQISELSLTPLDGPGSAVWNGSVFGPNQEAYVTLDSVTATSPNHALLLKVQGTSPSAGHVQVAYEAPFAQVSVALYSPGAGWTPGGVLAPVTLSAGDQFGARALVNGIVQVLKNGQPLGEVSIASWAYAHLGGRLGLTLANAGSSRLENFGGGELAFVINTPPVAQMTSPVDGGFFVEGDTLWLHGGGSDAETPEAGLQYSWRVDLHHNTHIHPGSFVSNLRDDFLIAENHDDGTGVHLVAHLEVVDGGGMIATASAAVYPEVNLRPMDLVSYGMFFTGIPVEVEFAIENTGRMPAPYSRWAIVTEDGVAAEGDTIVPPLDRVIVSRMVVPGPAGPRTLRVVVDSLAGVTEVDEGDNQAMTDIVVATPPLAVADQPRELEVSAALPNPTHRGTAIQLALPSAAAVGFTVYDPQGRSVWSAPAREHSAGRWRLVWPGVSASGRLVAPGVYLAVVTVGDRTFVRRIARLR